MEQKFNRLLWNGSDESAAKAKVSWVLFVSLS